MMNKKELTQDPFNLDDEHEVEYFEHLYYDMAHDRSEKIDTEDYEDDYESYWALKELKKNHFHLFFVFYSVVSFILGVFEYEQSGMVLNTYSLVFFTGSALLFAMSIFIYTAHMRHEDELLKYRSKRIKELIR